MEWTDLEGTEVYQTGSDERRKRIRAGWERDFSADYPEATVPAVSSDAPDFIPGVKRGLQNLQAMGYGAGALVGGTLKDLGAEFVGQKLQDIGMEGYRRNIEEAKQYPKKHSFKDIYTGNVGDGGVIDVAGGALDWAQGTLGELVPSMVEAAGGAAIGSAIAPGPGTAVGAFAGRTVLKKGIEELVKKGIKGKTEAEARKLITRQALKKLGGKAGIAGAVMPMESGGMYADLLEEKGINAPETALLFGAIATSFEFFGGNSKLVDTFIDALSNGSKGLAKRSAKEILTNIPQEALQEGGQELMGILNTVANTDEVLITAENVEAIIESMAAGAVGGGAGAVMQTAMNQGATEPTPEPPPSIDRSEAGKLFNADKRFTSSSGLTDNYPGQAQDERAQAEANKINQFNNSPEGVAYNKYHPDVPITEMDLRRASRTEGFDVTDNAVEDAKIALKILDQRFDQNEQAIVEDYWEGVQKELKLSREEMTPGTEAFLRKKFFETKLAEIEGNVKQDIESKAAPEKKDTLSLAEQNKRQAWFREVAEDLGDFPTEQSQAVVPEGTNVVKFGSEVELQSEQSVKTITNEYGDVVEAAGTQVADSTDTAIDNAEAYIHEEDARKYVLDSNRQGQRENYPRTDEVSVDDPIKNVIDEIEYSVYNPESPLSIQRDTDVINTNGKPYKVLSPLMKKLDALPNPENYEIIETKDGFVGRLVQGSDSSFTNEQQEEGIPQFQTAEPTVKYDGEKDGLHYHTIQDGPAKGATFASMTNEPDDVRQRMEITVEKFKAANPQFEVRDAVHYGSYTGGAISSAMLHSGEGNSILGPGIYFSTDLDLGKNVYSKYGNETNISAELDNFYDPINGPNLPGVDAALAEAGLDTPEKIDRADSRKSNLKHGRWKIGVLVYTVGQEKARELFVKHGIQGAKEKLPDGSYEIAVFDDSLLPKIKNDPQFQTREIQEINQRKLNLTDIEKLFPGQEVSQDADGKVSIKLKNGKGITFQSIQKIDDKNIQMAIKTGQMSKVGNILGLTVDSDVLLNENFADNRTLWHENKHVLDNLGMITEADNSALNAEFNKLRKSNKLDFALSTHEDPKQAMVENRANMFAQIMVNRKTYRDTTFGKVIQRVMDFFNQLLNFGKQSISGLAREVESGKIYERKVGDQTYDTTVPQAEVREPANQLLSEAQYDKIFNQKQSLVKGFAQQARIKLTEAKLLADKALGPISTRLGNVDPELREKLRWLDRDTSQKVIDVLKVAKRILDVTNGKKNLLGVRSGGMTNKDLSDWNWARLNSDKGKIEQLAQKYNLTEDLIELREKMNQIREDAKDVNYDVGFIDEYWPRVIKDREGFLQATEGISQDPVFSQAIRAEAKKLGLTQEQFEADFPDVKADIISNLILGRPSGIGGPGNIQERKFPEIPPEFAPFYMDADASLMQYVYSMTKKIEARKFFGKVPKRISDLKAQEKKKTAELVKLEQLADMDRVNNPEKVAAHEKRITQLNEDLVPINESLNLYKINDRDFTENIGAYIGRLMAEGKVEKKDEKLVRDILDARFHEQGTHGIVNAYKNFAYIDTMGSFMSAITQIGDLAWAMYVGKAWTPKGFIGTGKNLYKAITNQSAVTKEDIGIERIAQEFADGTTLGNAVSWVFKVVGLEKIDSIGKEVLINNALDQYKIQARLDPKALVKQIKPTFGKESENVIEEILAYDPNGNVDPSDNIKMLAYSKLLDFQPVALSEMTELYLNGGNGRVFYMLKTYTMKQLDVFRREVGHNLKSENKQDRITGIKNMVQLLSLLTLANATADELKDFLLGRETKFSDNVMENLMTIGGASRYTKMQISKEGFGSAALQQILPPAKFINSASKDIAESYKDYVSGDTQNFDNARIIDSLPVAGKLLYWHYGRGNENKQSINEQEFKKAGKDARLLKKQIENSDDKRMFITTNLDRFKQMKLHENFQGALNRNKAVINKLKKIPETENVLTRLGQLKAQREQILQRYVEVSESLI